MGISLLVSCAGKSEPLLRSAASGDGGPNGATEPPGILAAPGSSSGSATGEAPCATIDKSYGPEIDPADFVKKVDHPLFPLVEGATYKFSGPTKSLNVNVTYKTKDILRVKTIGVQSVLKEGGQVLRDTMDWYAQDKSGAVWLLGEEAKKRDGSGFVTTAWEAGKDYAQPGLMMPTEPDVGQEWRQKYYPCKVEDQVRVLALNAQVNVSGGAYNDCLQTQEFTALDPAVNIEKYYCPKTGLAMVADNAPGGERLGLSESKVPDPNKPNPFPPFPAFPDAGIPPMQPFL